MSDLPHCSHASDNDDDDNDNGPDHFALSILAIAFRISTVAK
jgi:hypothetical protein